MSSTPRTAAYEPALGGTLRRLFARQRPVATVRNPKALEEAAALDTHFRKTGQFVGALHGIPVLRKDNVNTSDMPTTGGSLSLAGYTPGMDAMIAQKLRGAGAVRGSMPNEKAVVIHGLILARLSGSARNASIRKDNCARTARERAC